MDKKDWNQDQMASQANSIKQRRANNHPSETVPKIAEEGTP